MANEIEPTNPELRAKRDKARGFDPESPRFEYFGCFTLADATKSLFDSTRHRPVPVFLSDRLSGGPQVPVVIDLARPLFDPALIGRNEEWPDWYFEGWTMTSAFASDACPRRVRISVATLGGGEFAEDDIFHWQWISEEKSRRPE